MTRTEIIAELRRSAREDEYPWVDVHHCAFVATLKFKKNKSETPYDLSDAGCRTIFLIVAHALEDECSR